MLETLEPEAPSAAALPRERIAVAALLVGTAVLYLWNLSVNGWANQFYAAAVQAGSVSWKAFLFGSSDAANSITVDKPPLFLWPMDLSVRIFGFGSWSMLVPEVLIGVAGVALLWWIVRRHVGPAAAFTAAAVLALTPIFWTMSRYNNPEPMMLLLMIASVWAILEAVRDGRLRWLVLCGVFVGLGFLTKQLEALVVLPALGITYLAFGPPRLAVRLGQLTVAALAALFSGGWWVALAELWPASSRPWIGGSSTNSFLQLTFEYNGLDRLNDKGAGNASEVLKSTPLASDPGLGRMFSQMIGGQITWVLVPALVLSVVGLVLLYRADRADPQRACVAVFAGWLLVTWLLFDFMSGKGGHLTPYYTVALAPAIAAEVGIGAALLWRRREQSWVQLLSAVLVLGTAGWAWVLLGRESGFVPWLRWVIVAVALAAVIAWHQRLRSAAVAAAASAMLVGPFAFGAATLDHGLHGGMPLAGPTVGLDFFKAFHAAMREASGNKDSKVTPALAAILKDAPKDDDPGQEDRPGPAIMATLEHGADAYTWMAAAVRSNSAAPYQLTALKPVLPVGGFTGRDPFPTLDQFQDYVARHRIHYFIVDEPPAYPAQGDSTVLESTKITEWVERTFTPQGFDGVAVFDLTKPAAVPAQLTATAPITS